MTTNPALDALDRQIKAQDELNDGVLEPYLSNRENLKIISLTVREAKAIRTALTSAPSGEEVRLEEVLGKATHPGHRIRFLMHKDDVWILETLIRAAQSNMEKK